MQSNDFNDLATVLIDSYAATGDYRHTFMAEHGDPPTLLARVHHMRSIVQSRLIRSPRFELNQEYAEFGRVQYTDSELDRVVLVRSASSVTIERATLGQPTLFEAARYIESDVLLAAYKFHRDGLEISLAGTKQEIGKKRLSPSGPPGHLGFWAYDDFGNAGTFPQGAADVFSDLGDLDIETDGEI